MATEREILAAISAIFSRSSDESVLVGIGDDAAVIKAALTPIALASDMAVEGTHFSRNWSSLYEIGAKITAANLADIFAMGGRPEYLLVSAALPKSITVEEVEELALGIADEAALVGASVVGGDLASSEKIVISISAFGAVGRPILRSGAKVGDQVVVSKLPGESAAGLEYLKRGVLDSSSAHHRHPTVDYQSAQAISAIAHSMIDVSDGLVSELSHIASASSVGITIDKELLASSKDYSDLARSAMELGVDVWQWVLHGGEDHVFIATIPSEAAVPRGFLVIGKVIEGSRVMVDGFVAEHEGFSHF
jgi:thiamine-monophosphate kinase